MDELTCPNCGKKGTAAGCKDFNWLGLGEYSCKTCGHTWSLFKKAPENASDKERKKIIEYNIKVANGLLDLHQKRAADAILYDCLPKKVKKVEKTEKVMVKDKYGWGELKEGHTYKVEKGRVIEVKK